MPSLNQCATLLPASSYPGTASADAEGIQTAKTTAGVVSVINGIPVK